MSRTHGTTSDANKAKKRSNPRVGSVDRLSSSHETPSSSHDNAHAQRKGAKMGRGKQGRSRDEHNDAVDEAPTKKHRAEWYGATFLKLKAAQATLNGTTAVMLHLAAYRVHRMNLAAEATMEEVGALVTDKKWDDVVRTTLSLDSAASDVQKVEAWLTKHVKVIFWPGLLEFLTKADFESILDSSWSLDHPAQDAVGPLSSDAKRGISERLLIVGMCRYNLWFRDMLCGQDPYESSRNVKIEYAKEYRRLKDKFASVNVQSFACTIQFLDQWEKRVEKTSFLGIVYGAGLFRNSAHVIMTKAAKACLEERQIASIDNSLGLINVFGGQLPAVVRRTSPMVPAFPGSAPPPSISVVRHVAPTLVICGESGSGKTLSSLATTTESHVLGVYLMMSDFPAETIDQSDQERFNNPAHSTERNQRYAKLIVDGLVAIDSRIKEQMVDASSGYKVVIIVDEVGNHPHFVRAMCSRSFLLMAPNDSGKTLEEHLGVDSIQLIVAGTGVSVEKDKCGSVPGNFEHIVLKCDVTTAVIAKIASQIEGDIPWFRRFQEVRQSHPCEVLQRIEDLKTNPRMYACFAAVVRCSLVFKKFVKPNNEIPSELGLQVSLDAHYYSELRSCSFEALVEFAHVNGLRDLSYFDSQRAIFRALGYSCLPWDFEGCAPVELLASCGVLVDQITYPPHANNRGTDLTTKEKLQQFVTAKTYHRYAVSAAHIQLALGMLGVREPVWTRLGFERVVMDVLYLHTFIALNTVGELAAPGDGDARKVFNDIELDPLHFLKAEVWHEAQALSAANGARGVIVLTTSLPHPGRDADGGSLEDTTWPQVLVDGEKLVRAIPAKWLVRSLEHRVLETLSGYFGPDANAAAAVVPIIVLAMLYQDAPGIDGVIAYGTIRRGTDAAVTFHATSLTKLQMKYHDGAAERLPTASQPPPPRHLPAQSQAEAQSNSGLPAVKAKANSGLPAVKAKANSGLPAVKAKANSGLHEENHTKKTIELLTRMGRPLTLEQNEVAGLVIRHRLVVYDAAGPAKSCMEHAVISSATLREALHPSSWKPACGRQNEYHEQITHTVGV